MMLSRVANPVFRRFSRAAAYGVVLGAFGLSAGAPSAWAQQVFELNDAGWEQIPMEQLGTPEAELLQVRRLLAQEQFKKAQRLATQWIDARPNHPAAPEAYLLRGDALTGRREYFKALFDYEFIARSYPASEVFMTALEREYEIARLFIDGLNRKLWGMRLVPAEGEAEELLIRIQERAPGSELGERAMLELANYYFANGEMSKAAEVYALFLENYPRSLSREWVMLRQIQASLATFKGPRFDPTGLLEAQQRLEEYQAEFPALADRIGAQALQVRIDESLALKELTSAQWYRQRGEPIGESYLLRRVIRDYPQTAAAKDALARLNKLGQPLVPGTPMPDQLQAADDAASGDQPNAPADTQPVEAP